MARGEWLREQEADKIRRWTLDAAVIAAAVGVITLLATLGVIKCLAETCQFRL